MTFKFYNLKLNKYAMYQNILLILNMSCKMTGVIKEFLNINQNRPKKKEREKNHNERNNIICQHIKKEKLK